MTTREMVTMTNETVGDKQLWLAAEVIVVGKFGTHAVYKELQRVRDDAAQMIQAYYIDVIEGKDARIANLDRELANKQDTTMQDETVGKLWTFEQIQEAVKKVAHNVPPYKGTQAVTAFQAEQLMGLVRNDKDATIATQAARIDEDDALNQALAARVLELEVAYQEFSAIIANEGDEIAKLEAELERLRDELAEATGQLLSWHYDTKHEWGFPLSEEVWANNPLRQRYKDLTGADWIEPVKTDMDDDDDAPTQAHEGDE